MFRNKRAGRPKAGFSVIEVLIAIMVVGIGFLATASMQGTSISGNNQSSYLTQAVYLAEDRIEELRNRPMAGLDTVGSPQTGIDEQGATGTGGIFTRSWSVTPNTPGPFMTTMAVNITWTERGINHNLTMNSIRIY